MSEAAPSAPNAPLWMETGMGGGESQNCDPPKYSDVVRPANQAIRQTEIRVTPVTTSEGNPLLAARLASAEEDTECNHFDIVRYVLCWTGVSTAFCRFCGYWYVILGLYGFVNCGYMGYLLYLTQGGLIVSRNLTLSDNYTSWKINERHLGYSQLDLMSLFMVGGVASLLLFFMWLFTVLFFHSKHPRKKWHDPHFRFNRRRVNTGPIVCCFLLSVGLFGGVTMTMTHALVGFCNFFSPPVLCSVYSMPQTWVMFMMAATGANNVIVLGFICMNCFFYQYCVRSHTGNFCF